MEDVLPAPSVLGVASMVGYSRLVAWALGDVDGHRNQ
jgi:hypothetical protein